MRAPTCPPGIASAGVAGIFGTYNSLVRASTDYWTGALSRGASPLEVGLDALDWLNTMTRRETPRWASDHVIAQEWPIARLLDFSGSEPAEQIATLVLPPQAGHSSCIVDFAAGQSQIATAQQAGLTRIFALDWLGATPTTKDASIEDYLAVVASTVQRLGGVVNLVGDCQGGWLAVIYAALHPEQVHTLTIAGAPVDFHAGGAVIQEWMDVLRSSADLALYRSLVAAGGGMLPGECQLAGFIAMQPEVELDRQLQLLVHLREPEHVARYRTFETWFKHTQPIPGAFYLWIVEHLFQKNELIAGTLEIEGTVVDLKQITCPLFLLAGSEDHITPGAQVFALGDYAGTSSDRVVKRIAPGGHLGLFMGHESLEKYWTPLFAAIAAEQPVAKVAASVPAARPSRR
jgi:poly(3-hydroxybutyrate) depolymerase